ncbi:phage terminase small subunit P27 family [Paucibacter sp. R3-3]|uniref:Phage terminase small subunit P27 family n=1 Tax=Roseateles agri TaxID=3098619 RepID=A0ABU5DS32_9BURK|nr:phage terminase small subunit P27 family [Paucibacter sp. R3-3]MDY0748516.1 phage terminase small subunit P27 family [Paucibacter sp. R3-3]
MGRKALPANVHLLRGNPSKLSAADLTDGLQPEVEIPGCPKHLLPEARKEWRRIAPELERYGLISKLDRSALALYCQAWARLVWSEEQLARAMGIAETRRAEAEARGEEWKGGDGMTIPTPGGHMTYSPHWVIANKAAQQVQTFLAEFGLSPATRGKVSTSAVRQRELFTEGEPEGDARAGYGGL